LLSDFWSFFFATDPILSRDAADAAQATRTALGGPGFE
jgi:hypothetical protein